MSPAEFKTARLTLGLKTQADAAQALGYGRTASVGAWERGEVDVPRPVALLFAAMIETGWRPGDWPK